LNNKKIIEMLNEDMMGEHAAIVQYLQHAWSLPESTLRSSIEGIARDEMWHLHWLAEVIAKLGGIPTLKRDIVFLKAENAEELFQMDVRAEQEAIEKYKAHRDAIDDPSIKRLLTRIVSDEEAHMEKFQSIVEKAKAEDIPIKPYKPQGERNTDEQCAMMNNGAKHEYNAIVQYLHQAFTSNNPEVWHELEEIAIDEMKHMGWYSEEVADLDGYPDIEMSKIETHTDIHKNIQKDIEDETEAVKKFGGFIEKLESPEHKDLVERIKYHEEYHIEQLKEILEELEEEAPPITEPKREVSKFTVGSLLNKK
jgi:bacterioferritin